MFKLFGFCFSFYAFGVLRVAPMLFNICISKNARYIELKISEIELLLCCVKQVASCDCDCAPKSGERAQKTCDLSYASNTIENKTKAAL